MAVSRQISRSISLTSLACELIHAIAFYVALPTDPFNVKPPSHLIALLLASRAFYSTLNYRDNPYLYARIFRATFDTSALYRRFPASLITAPALAEELIRRWTILSRIRWRTSSEPFLWNRRRYRTEIAVEELLMSFILFTESDGPNARILTNYARIEKYLQSYQYLVVNPMHQDPRMPEESHETSLWLWLNWFTLDYKKAMCEESDVRGNMQDFILLPYVLGTFKYTHAHAPYEYLHLPLAPSSPSNLVPSFNHHTHPALVPAGHLPPLAPRPTTSSCYLSTFLSYPILSQAAALLWFARIQDRPVRDPTLPDTVEGPVVPAPELLQTYHQHEEFASVSTLNDRLDFTNRTDSFTPDYMRIRYASIADSRRWDGEWARLVGCNNPTRIKQIGVLEYRYTPGRMTGCWDGRLLIPDHGAFHAIAHSVENNPEDTLNILEDPNLHKSQLMHSLSVTEYHYRPTLLSHSSSQLSTPIRPGPAINAHLPEGLLVENMASVWDPSLGRWRNGIMVREGSRFGAPSFYEAVPANAEYMPDVSQSPNNVSIIVIGDATAPPSSSPNIVTTNPAGSRFMGTIRPWDGLITIRNKSTDTRFGTFVYTGYLVGGGMGYDEERGNWVGRWREGHAQFGSLTWEGTFCMRKRFA